MFVGFGFRNTADDNAAVRRILEDFLTANYSAGELVLNKPEENQLRAN